MNKYNKQDNINVIHRKTNNKINKRECMNNIHAITKINKVNKMKDKEK